MLKEIIIAIQAYFKAHRFIKENKLWKWILIPGILYTLLFTISLYYFSSTSTEFIEWFILKAGLKSWIEKVNDGSVSFLLTFGTMVIWFISLMLYFSLFKYLFLIIGSPIFAYLSEKTAAIMEGNHQPINSRQLLIDSKRGIQLAVRNSFWQTIYILSILIVSLLPVVGWLTPFLVLIIECYYYGFSMVDYSLERKKMSATQSRFFISNHKGVAIGNGMVFYMFHLLPIIGWVLAPAYAVVAATLHVYSFQDSATASDA